MSEYEAKELNHESPQKFSLFSSNCSCYFYLSPSLPLCTGVSHGHSMALMKIAYRDKVCGYCISWRDPFFQALQWKNCHLQWLCLTDLSIIWCNYGYLFSSRIAGRGEFSSIHFQLNSPITTALKKIVICAGKSARQLNNPRSMSAIRQEGRRSWHLQSVLRTETALQTQYRHTDYSLAVGSWTVRHSSGCA